MIRRALIALLVAATAAHAAPSPEELRLCELINQQRVENGAPALRLSDELFAAAGAHSDDMAANECFQHDSCGGERWSKRVGRYYPGWVALGETITYFVDPADAVAGWMNSPTHRAILLSRSFTDVGCGTAVGGAWHRGLSLATADFGSRGLLPGPTPEPTGTAGLPTLGAGGVDRFTVRSTRTSTTLNARVTLPAGARLDATVALEIDDKLVAAIPADCIALHGRGARSTCVGADVRITPAGVPRYRIRLRFAGVHAPASTVRLSAAGQTWDLNP